MARKSRQPSTVGCNVLLDEPVTSRLWQFAVGAKDVRLQQATEVPREGRLPAKLVGKGWRDLVARRLNIAWLPTQQVFLRVVHLPTDDPAEVPAMLELQLERLSPLTVGQAVWSYERLPRGSGTGLRVVLLVAERSALDPLLARLETRGYMVDRLEFPFLHQLAETPVQEDGAYVYAWDLDGQLACLVAWWTRGELQLVQVVNLPPDDSWPRAVAEELRRITWAGEIEGWLEGPQSLHLVAGEARAAEWRTRLEGELGRNVQVIPMLTAPALATINVRRVATRQAEANLLPADIAARSRQQFIDRLWMGGLGTLFAIYLLGVLGYFGALEWLKWRQGRIASELAGTSQSYTNALRLKAHAEVLQEQINLRYSALDCWLAIVECLPEDLVLRDFNFSRGRSVTISGYGPGDQGKLFQFSQALTRKVIGRTNLFSRVETRNSTISAGLAGPRTESWSLACEIRRPDA